MSSTIRKSIRAQGRVQGVFFRDSTRRRAEQLGVAGWVRNREDGSVEAMLEGEAAAVEALIELLRAGPGRAEVERLEISEEPPEGITGFRIL